VATKPIEIRCPIYGFIPLDGWERDIVESPPFQRLRRIRQLAWTDYVYPGAMHTRFEHTLGVMHMATMLFDALVHEDRPSRAIIIDHLGGKEWLDPSRLLVRLAALTHDLGHPPFSHAGEELMPLMAEGSPARHRHEEYSAAIIRSELRPLVDQHPSNAHGITADQVAGLIDPNAAADAGRLLFWKPLVNGQLDADRMDYLLRDSYHTGVQYGRYDWSRLVNTITVSPAVDERGPRIGVTEGGWNAAEGLIVARYMMYNQVYSHRTRVILDVHLQKALHAMLVDAGSADGTFALPQETADLRGWDDWRVLGELARGGGGEHGLRLRERRLYKLIRETPAYPDKRDLKLLGRWREALGDDVAAELSSERSWYKLDDTDIPVVSADAQRRVRTLSSYSPLIRGMKKMQQVRLYVDDMKRADCEQRLAKIETRRIKKQ